MRHIGMLLLFFSVIFIAACGGNNSSDVGSKEAEKLQQSQGIPTLITLSCNQAHFSKTCRDVEFDRADEIQIVTEAIFSAERMQGMLDYSAEYTMNITYADGAVTRYDLSLGADPKTQGLLVNQKDTTTGYTIPLENANQLRQIIQRRTD
ncbi:MULTISPECIES: hypothetical protein [Paenibacillus]|uniref:YhfM-like domain-containing protein n=1 Tax=Paenibacillus cucumis (ex Kampfer et al. 2016) TaxID=1776858 RepID=A0ABS7KDT4_9BACL|nr:hypothetical protein [Paenibacillus cucumis (ex Kampfer et al. 2016)]MBY0202308.1 hypothetical protein [Paenibacillus cucumis (ex Kampfer et al. 2016)]MDP9701436.1 hypothetical protein [Paenibacillus intestini]